jgi:hypothetical protein
MTRWVVLLGAFLMVVNAFGAAEPERECVICEKGVRNSESRWEFPVMSDTLQQEIQKGSIKPSQFFSKIVTNIDNSLKREFYVNVCDKCHKLKERCFVCGLPIKQNGFSTRAGRWICEREASLVVIDGGVANEVFESARKAAVDCVGNFFTLQNRSVTVSVEELFYNKVDSAIQLARCTSYPVYTGNYRFLSGYNHFVTVFLGRPREEVFYSCVQMYTHLWINEYSGTHEINKEMGDALSELVAYKVAESRHDAAAKRRVLASRRANGRLKELLQYEAKHGLTRILDWVPCKTTSTLGAFLVTASSAKPQAFPKPLDDEIAKGKEARQTREELSLNGMIHTPKGTVILLTGGLILGKGESGVLKLNGEQSHVRCIDIQSNAAVVNVEHQTNPVTLFLGKSAKRE